VKLVILLQFALLNFFHQFIYKSSKEMFQEKEKLTNSMI